MKLKDCECCGGRYSQDMEPLGGYVCTACRKGDKMKRNDNWPYETLEQTERSMTEKDWRNARTVVAIIMTVILSVWIGLMMARGL